jgi:hypothetical protein
MLAVAELLEVVSINGYDLLQRSIETLGHRR